MPVDRPDPADDPDEPGLVRPPDDPRAPDAAPPLPLDRASRVAVHRANRAQVEQAYAAHEESAHDDTRGATADADADRDSWSDALPSLRAAWDQHQDLYPERERATPRTHTDGSWSSGEAHRLTPEQNAEATKACADIHDEGERVVLPAMRQIEAANPSRGLAGLEHMLKGADRLKEKIADILLVESRLSPREALDKVPDAVRYTFTYSPDRYAEGVRADIDRLKADGFEEIKLKNLWSGSQYKGINTQWRRPETGLRFEVQFHTPESLQAKELTHGAYDRLRRPENETTQVERDELEEFQRRVNKSLVMPPSSEEIRDFPERKR
ncbi:MAG: hypothetical protein JWM85_2131 [Acidimicrobiaceae bacterium]|nr:hypothetical protein [Acidimicrobiaceae bacterium]